MKALNIDLQKIVIDSIKETVNANHDPDINISIWIEKLGEEALTYHHYPTALYHPASLIKLFNAYLAKYKLQTGATHLLNEHMSGSNTFGQKTHMDDIYDAIDAALRLSDNDALSYLVDFNSAAYSGPRLSAAEFALFKRDRNTISEFFRKKTGYSQSLNIPGKCFSFAPYGREVQLSLEEGGLGRNSMEITDAAQIVKDIISDYPELLQSIRRKIDNSADEQCQFIAKGLIPYQEEISYFASKAGWTSKVRHDVAYFKTAEQAEYIMVIMTRGLSQFTELVPSISGKLFGNLS
jgi:hypothetical protein